MKLSLVLSPLVCSLLAVACASQPADSSSAAEGALHTAAGVCATLDYGHTTTPAEFYRKFDSDEAAGTYIKKLIEQGQLAGTSGPNAAFKEISTDAHLLGLVGEVFEGFKKAFPAETAGMTDAPRVAIVQTDIVNAYAMGPGFVEDASAPRDKAPWVFIVHTALLDTPRPDNALRGLFAHELGHLILRTFLPEIRQKVRAIYLTPQSEDGVLGADQDNDPHVQAHVEEILKRQSRVGGIADLGLPVAETLSTYPKIFKMLIGQAAQGAADPTQVCNVAKDKSVELLNAQKALIPGIALGNLVPSTPTAEQKANLDRLSNEIADALRTCLAPIADSAIGKATLLELTAGLNNMEAALDPASPDHAKLLGLMLDAETQVDAATPDGTLIDRLLKAQEVIRKEYIALRDDPAFPVDQIRVFDYEEDADDAAARVLTKIGDDALGIGEFLLSILPDEAARTSCLADITAHKPIAYGRFIDTHPSTCWRYYHNTQFAKALTQCAAPASGKPRGGAPVTPSVTDRPATEMVEKGYGRPLE
jgi:hypothetical protein